MPWSKTSPMDQRLQFIAQFLQHRGSVVELCDRFGISRKTAYKWFARYMADGPVGLLERSRRPRSCPHTIPRDVVDALLEIRRRHPSWGAKKLLTILQNRRPELPPPARSTVCDLLKRHGLVKSPRRRRRLGHPGRPMTVMSAPNLVWTADFKGQFRTRDGAYCYPLTVADGFSRYLLGCQALLHPSHATSKPVFERLFREYGLPQLTRPDNGAPFATTSLGRLSELSVWWIRLGIRPELTEPVSPQQNGRHERMHRTLKAEPTRPAAATCSAQQRSFNRFRQTFNEERPHEALGQKTPASIYQPSSRSFPRRVPPIDYPSHFEVRLVSRNGGIRWNCAWVNVSHVLGGQYVGLEEVDDGLLDLYFNSMKLGQLQERILPIADHYGRTARKNVSPMSPD